VANLSGMTSIQRRTLLGGALVGLAAANGVRRETGPRPGLDGLLSLFRDTPVVALNEGVHHLQDSWDFLAAAMFRPAFDAVVIELGNSRHQDVADEYVSGGVVRKSDLQKIWRDTTQSPLDTGDVGVHFRVLSLARALNLFAGRSLRVLLADPPIDWTQIHAREDLDQFLMRRAECWADVITREVLAKGRRCLTIGGGWHFFRNLPTRNVPVLVEQAHPGTVSVVHTHALATTARAERCVAGWPRPSIAATCHTAYGRLPIAELGGLPPGADPALTVADVADQVLFLGHRRDLTSAVPEWEVYFEPAYWAELNRRKEVTGFAGELTTLRREGAPAMFPEER
jgi:hypothetical protein